MTFRFEDFDWANFSLLIRRLLELELVALELQSIVALQNNSLPKRKRDDYEFGCIRDIAIQIRDKQEQCIVHKNYGRSLSHGSAAQKFLKDYYWY